MFYSVTGTIVAVEEAAVVIDCHGVAFRCSTSLNTLKKTGEQGKNATLYTHLSVREDALTLFGFATLRELDCFRSLISVSGVGPKAALAVLSVLTPEELALSVATGDGKTITKAQGVGTRLAQRIVLELKDKLVKGLELSVSMPEVEAAGIAAASGSSGEAVSALTMLGYTQSEAALAVSRLSAELTVEELIRQALKILSRQV